MHDLPLSDTLGDSLLGRECLDCRGLRLKSSGELALFVQLALVVDVLREHVLVLIVEHD